MRHKLKNILWVEKIMVAPFSPPYHEDFYSSFTDDFQTLEYRLFYYDIDAAQYIEEAAAYQKLIIDGSAAGVGITDAIKDSLRTFGIIVEPATQTAELDNQ